MEQVFTDKQIQEFLTNRIVDKLVAFIMEDEGLDMDKALEKVYCSHVYELLQIKEGDLYSQSPSYVYELLKKEIGIGTNN